MPLRHPESMPFLTVLLALGAGLLGGLGGRKLAALQLRAELDELADLYEQQSRRIARREGQEGQSRKRSRRDLEAEIEQELHDRVAQTLQRPQRSAATTLEEVNALARTVRFGGERSE